MLSKVGITGLTIPGGEFATYGAGATSGSSSSSGNNKSVTYIDEIMPYGGDFQINISFSGYRNNITPSITLYIDNVAVESVVLSGAGGSFTYNYSKTITIKSGQQLKLSYYAYYTNSSYNGSLTATGGTLTCTQIVVEKDTKNPGKPRDIYLIGNLGITTIYGNHVDKVFYYGKMLSKDTSATTGSITLGNAVGYIRVNLNGDIVKIPYYYD